MACRRTEKTGQEEGDRMVEVGEKITRKSDVFYYGVQTCRNADDAYCRFRDDYHASLGKRAYRRLNVQEREERIHGLHFYFSDALAKSLDLEFGVPNQRIPCRLLGLVGISYCWGLDGANVPDYEDERFGRWLDWFLLHANDLMKKIGLNDGVGRTSKNKRRYR